MYHAVDSLRRHRSCCWFLYSSFFNSSNAIFYAHSHRKVYIEYKILILFTCIIAGVPEIRIINIEVINQTNNLIDVWWILLLCGASAALAKSHSLVLQMIYTTKFIPTGTFLAHRMVRMCRKRDMWNFVLLNNKTSIKIICASSSTACIHYH